METTEAARHVVEHWLALNDAGEHEHAWGAAAAYFRENIGQPQWLSAVANARTPLGGVSERALKSTNPVSSVPGAPDGEYVVFQYESQFEHRRDMVETITAMREPDGAWKVAGYFIH